MAGTVRICEEQALKQNYFEQNPTLKTYYKSVDDPNYTLLEIQPKKVEWMDKDTLEYKEVAWD
jgi:general stress protein 26